MLAWPIIGVSTSRNSPHDDLNGQAHNDTCAHLDVSLRETPCVTDE